MATAASCLYFGRVMHRRIRPFAHHFVYRVFSLFVDIDELPALARRLRLFSHNRFNLLSFHDRDHGACDGTPLRPWIETLLRRAAIELDGGPVRLLCFPRLLGYAFNPLAIWFCHRPGGELVATVYEVRNTFGERHCYVLPASAGAGGGGLVQQACPKRFYVSPFLAVAGHYAFRLFEPAERMSIAIRLSDDDGDLLTASHIGTRAPLDDRTLLRACLGYPLMTVKVIVAIHWQALRLWRKGARLHTRLPHRLDASVEPLAVATDSP